jgi:undecaprenyl pyrophosphate phosphatase UppP
MIFAFGVIGFILGFAAGLFIINLFLRHYSKKDLLKDKSLRWTYGLAVWIFAGLGAGIGVWLYERSVF